MVYNFWRIQNWSEAQRNGTLDSDLSSPSGISTQSRQSRISTILSNEVGFDSHLNLRSLSCFHSIFLVLCELFLDLWLRSARFELLLIDSCLISVSSIVMSCNCDENGFKCLSTNEFGNFLHNCFPSHLGSGFYLLLFFIYI